MKPYQTVPIRECGEALVPIPLAHFAVCTPHPYAVLGAPYGDRSPYFLRIGVLARLKQAQAFLQKSHPGWHLQIFDAYRPISVQQFMVDYTFNQLVTREALDLATLNEAERSHFKSQVAEFWAVPSLNPKTPPPHSTGAAIDLTLVNADDRPVEMGSAIDEISSRSYPNHFKGSNQPSEQRYHAHRSLLSEVMQIAGFHQHPNEWWHFSAGDQLWAWQSGNGAIARYGNAEFAS
ncbi:MAG: M15 family metallopeptidase [Phormidesmis sp.]